MQQQHLFEYAIVRIVPRVEREEFLNAGVLLFCPKQKFLRLKFSLDKNRLKVFSSEPGLEELRKYLEGFERICSGDVSAGAIGKLTMAERFRWLTATRSTVLQTSKVHPGLCDDAAAALDKIFGQFVL